MPSLLIRHKVTDFDTWRRAFDEDAGTRRANGSIGWRVFRSSAETNEIWILLEWEDLMRARLFAKSNDLSDVLVRAGVTDLADYWFLDGMDIPSR